MALAAISLTSCSSDDQNTEIQSNKFQTNPHSKAYNGTQGLSPKV